jgi:hypothetical protein
MASIGRRRNPVAQTPTIGRVVHYTTDSPSPRIRAAIIIDYVENSDESVTLSVFHPVLHQTPEVLMGVERSSFEAGLEQSRGKWQWPKREN